MAGKLAAMKVKQELSFLLGATDMARRMRHHDWSASTLGQPRQWPQSLRSVVNLLLGSAFPMFVAWGPELALLYNDGYAELLAEKHPSALGMPFFDVWHEAHAELEPLVQRALGGESFYMENLFLRLRRHGDDHQDDAWFTFSYSPVLDDAGMTAGFYCACIETTAMVLAEREQRNQQQRLQTLFMQTPGFTAVLRGPEHVFEIANQAYLQLTGFRDVLGKSIAEALPEVIGQGFVKLLDDVRKTRMPYVGRSMRVMLERVRGEPFSEAYLNFVFQPIIDVAGEVEGIFVQGYDVTQEHNAQQALLAFSNSIPAIAWVASADGAIERFNSQWTRYTGQNEADALNAGWLRVIHPDDAGLAWQAAASLDAEWQGEYRLRRHDGVYHWFITRAVPQLDAKGQVLSWFGTTTDIEYTRRAADELRNADRQKDEFLATLAHELRNPLAPIRSATRLLSSAGSDEAVRLRATRVIERQATHMAHLLDDLIDIARITQRRLVLKKAMVPVASVVDSALEAARPGLDAKGHALTLSLSEEAGWVEADPIRLAQVLSNLLNNAAKYTDVGGSIHLEAGVDDGWLVFAVTDTGIGLESTALEKVFLMFSQEQSALDRSEGGLGIGLALSKGLVELHGGSIFATSEGLGHGSRFEVRLPHGLKANDRTTDAGPTMSESVIKPPRAITVLLADDNRDAAETLAELLRLDGHVVLTAYDGLQALEMAMQLQPEVIVLDIGMPSLNGYEVAQRIRAQPWGSQPLMVAATGWGQDDDRKKALHHGFDLHLTKPFDPQELMDLIAARATALAGR
ncbi:MAG: hybrid sensor histidine kinase/response regulator [Polaromonas sp.]|nr:hybrid sensor histidine kinase/response regulator [Polaromonas sp.]